MLKPKAADQAKEAVILPFYQAHADREFLLDMISLSDRDFFERNPKRRFRVREPDPIEVATLTSFEKRKLRQGIPLKALAAEKDAAPALAIARRADRFHNFMPRVIPVPSHYIAANGFPDDDNAAYRYIGRFWRDGSGKAHLWEEDRIARERYRRAFYRRPGFTKVWTVKATDQNDPLDEQLEQFRIQHPDFQEQVQNFQVRLQHFRRRLSLARAKVEPWKTGPGGSTAA